MVLPIEYFLGWTNPLDQSAGEWICRFSHAIIHSVSAPNWHVLVSQMLLHAEGVPTSRAADAALEYLHGILYAHPSNSHVNSSIRKWSSLHCRVLADIVMAAVRAQERLFVHKYRSMRGSRVISQMNHIVVRFQTGSLTALIVLTSHSIALV